MDLVEIFQKLKIMIQHINYRNAHYILSLQTKFENNDYLISNTNWLSNHYDYLSSLTYGNYINFPYYPLKDYEKEYYGYNLDRIRKIKEKYDPDRKSVV